MSVLRVLSGLIGVAALAYCGVGAVLYGLQRRIIFRPDATRPSLAGAAVPGLQAVSLRTRDGLELLAWWLPPPSADRMAVTRTSPSSA